MITVQICGAQVTQPFSCPTKTALCSCLLSDEGVILYILLCGETPFYGDTPNEILAHVKTGRYTMDQETWGEVSNSAQNLVEQLLCFDPDMRLTAVEALRHPWVVSEGLGRETPLYNAASAMRAFNSHRKVKKAMLGLMARTLDVSELNGIQALFEEADHNNTGSLGVVEMQKILVEAGYETMGGRQLASMFEQLDTEGILYAETIMKTLHLPLNQS